MIQRHRVHLFALLLVVAGVIISHVGWIERDNGTLLVVDGIEIDLLGQANNHWVRATRDCQHVAELQASEPGFASARQTLQAYSPPSSASARLASLWTSQTWGLAEVEFDELLPAVALMKATDNGWEIIPPAVWSGFTHPWEPAPLMRRYLKQQAPEVPQALLNCFEPRSPSFQPRGTQPAG